VILADRTPFNPKLVPSHNIEYRGGIRDRVCPDIAEASPSSTRKAPSSLRRRFFLHNRPRSSEVEDRYRKAGKEACRVWFRRASEAGTSTTMRLKGVMAWPGRSEHASGGTR